MSYQIKTFRDLLVWQKAHALTLRVYKMTQSFPKEERYGLLAQVRRSASSVPTNIVEGFKRRGRKEYAYFINVAETSLEETKYHVLLSKDLGYIEAEQYLTCVEICDELGRMLNALYKKLIK